MNPRAPKNKAYIPTLVEHVANVVTHGIGIVPALVGALELVRRSANWTQLFSAFVYGTSLIMLFIVSTFFHSVHYCHHEGYFQTSFNAIPCFIFIDFIFV